MKLSVILPSIRMGNIKRLYESIQSATKEEFELVVVSPYELPFYLKGINNIRCIKDYGNPVRCQQIGLVNSIGDYISWASDDGYFLPGSLDKSFELIKDQNDKTLVIGKYYEGKHSQDMEEIKYYYIYYHDGSRCEYLPTDCLMLMEGIVPRKLLFDIGGWDTYFEVLPMAFNDCSIRLYNHGCKFIFQNEVMFKCGHMPGTTGDHGPIHLAQTYHDLPKFKMIYSKPESKQRVHIPLNNWKNSPEKWIRRFGK